MGFSIAIGLLMLIGGFPISALIAFSGFIPSMAVMVLAERHAAPEASEHQPPAGT